MTSTRTIRRIAVTIGLATCAIGLSAQQMRTNGSLEVGDSGAARYTVPLSLPPNTGVNDPSLALQYDSHAGNGILGVGWSLSGISSITRCAKNVAEEGVRAGVKDDLSDIYCLDGQKLRLVSGIYGSNGAQYRTARDTYARITSYGEAGAGPQWFKVELKNGRILEFGNTADSRLELPSSATVRIWMLNAAQDRSAAINLIRYSYQKDVSIGEQVLSEIWFGGGYVAVDYEPRPTDDLIVKYENGAQLGSTNRRIKALRIHSTTMISLTKKAYTLYKEYRLGYDQSEATRRSLLSSLQECGAGGVDAPCLPSVKFKYQNTDLASLVLHARAAPANMTTAIDVRGNSRPELFRLAVGEPPPFYGSSRDVLDGYKIWDYNSDGRSDLQLNISSATQNTESQSYVLLSDGTTFISPSPQITSAEPYHCHGDIDGDGATDAIGVEYSIPNQPARLVIASWIGGTLSRRLIGANTELEQSMRAGCMVADINGDGRSELITIGGQDDLMIWSFDSASSGFSLQSLSAKSVGEGPILGDFNGDSKTDVLALHFGTTSAGGRLWLSNGSGLGPVISGSSVPLQTGYTVCSGDFNGDGRTDIYQLELGDFYLSTTTGFFKTASGIPPRNADLSGSPLVCADFDGDGRTDIYFKQGEIWSPNSVAATDYLAEVDSGAGQKFRIEYAPLSDASVYTKGAGATYPEVDLQPAMHVVARTQSSDGRGGFVPISYKYEMLRSDLQRNGTLGFSKITSLNGVSGIGTETTYWQTYPFVRLPYAVRKFKGAQTLEQIQYAYQALNQTAQYARVYQAVVSQQKFDLNGAFVDWIRESSNDPDEYGNLRQQITEHLAMDGATVSRQEANYGYFNDANRWLIGLVNSATTSSRVSSAAIPTAIGTPDTPTPILPPSPSQASIDKWLPAILSLLLDD